MKVNVTSCGAMLHVGSCTRRYETEYLAKRLAGEHNSSWNYKNVILYGPIEFRNIDPTDIWKRLVIAVPTCLICKQYAEPKRDRRRRVLDK